MDPHGAIVPGQLVPDRDIAPRHGVVATVEEVRVVRMVHVGISVGPKNEDAGLRKEFRAGPDKVEDMDRQRPEVLMADHPVDKRMKFPDSFSLSGGPGCKTPDTMDRAGAEVMRDKKHGRYLPNVEIENLWTELKN